MFSFHLLKHALHGIKERCDKIKKKLYVTRDEANKIEENTGKQSESEFWYTQRRYRITASKAYRLAVMKSTTSPTKALK